MSSLFSIQLIHASPTESMYEYYVHSAIGVIASGNLLEGAAFVGNLGG